MNPCDRRERTKFWLDAQLGNLELLRATYFTFAFAPHAHDTYAIGVTEAGAQSFTHLRNKHWIMPAGSTAIVHPGEVHTSQAADERGWTYRMFYPPAARLQGVASDLAGHPVEAPSFPEPVIYDPELTRRIQHFHKMLEDPATTALEHESGLLWVLGFLIQRHASGRPAACKANPEPTSVQRVCRYLDEHYSEQVALDQLANQAGLSPFHFLRVFRNTTGYTPHVYLTHVRIERAKRLLCQGMPLAEVAAETGFVDQSHFSKQFKRVLGVSPGQYR